MEAIETQEGPPVAVDVAGSDLAWLGFRSRACRRGRGYNHRMFSRLSTLLRELTTSRWRRVLHINNEGVILAQQGRLNEAMACFDEAIRLDPQFSGPYYASRAGVHLKLGNPDAAWADCAAALVQDPFSYIAVCTRGVIQYQRGKLDAAFDDFNESIRRNPRFAHAYASRGQVFFDRAQHDRALPDADLAIQLDRRCCEAYELRGRIFEATGKPLSAIDDFGKAIELAPQTVRLFIRRSKVRIALKQFNEAISDCDAALALDDANAVVSWFTVNWNLLGSALASGERHPARRSRRPAAKV